ncbi:hypothetical protein J5N58_16840 [Rhizobium cremeum]|uniref:hypothetical protein n=1 Tax=Rhizobium cremeum TaxID=2813827 RepID=UPI001FD461B1|nr:hypothetical protein [Rhizobium cremeum]MCJ7996087.1 hypothetical protein [Rhizobium cremeum]MCJ8001346.1 hypothetical protein [Rhizobium cremeum]
MTAVKISGVLALVQQALNHAALGNSLPPIECLHMAGLLSICAVEARRMEALLIPASSSATGQIVPFPSHLVRPAGTPTPQPK